MPNTIISTNAIAFVFSVTLIASVATLVPQLWIRVVQRLVRHQRDDRQHQERQHDGDHGRREDRDGGAPERGSAHLGRGPKPAACSVA